MENDNNHDPNDIESVNTSLVDSMKHELENLSPISNACCIYRVSERLRMSNDKVYTPQVVSIGPFHHGNPSLKPMEDHKKRYLKNFLQRTGNSLETYTNDIQQNEAKIRSSYAEPLGIISSDELVKMVLIDAGFVTEVMLRHWFDDFGDDHHYKTWMIQDVFPDLWLLENQLPFFILEDFLSTVDNRNLSIVDVTHKFFSGVMDFEREWNNLDHVNSSKILHLVDFLRKLYVPLSSTDDNKGSNFKGRLKTLTIPTASELLQCGVRIKTGSTTNLFEIQFCIETGVLEIPMLIIGFESELMIRNLLAFEQRHCTENQMNDYVVFMNRLVSAPEDVGLLVRLGIFENRLGDEAEVFRFVNKLTDGLIVKFGDFYYANVCEELNVYCRTRWNTWKENLKQNYFNTPWAVVSVFAASLLIVLTIIQAVCSVLSLTNYGDQV